MYCLIIGNPLNNPRSVKLWKSFFKKNKIPLKMKALEIEKKFFNLEIKKILKDPFFYASAVTMPYKKKIKKYIIINDKITKYARSVNFIIKNKKKFLGFNTDVYGALESIKKIKKIFITIYGFGGVGEALFRTLYKLYPNSKFCIISKKKIKFNKNRVYCKKKINKFFLNKTNLFVNCSPLGSNLNKYYLDKSPISLNNLKFLKKGATVFDVVYKPRKTLLSRYCKKLSINFIDGLGMNTIQAQKALGIIKKNFKIYEK